MSGAMKKLSSLIEATAGSPSHSQIVKARCEQNVLLTDWWLIEVDSKSKGRRLGVGGFCSRGRQSTRLFRSTAIIERLDAATLRTEDGITIILTGFINTPRTLENGFETKVCKSFLTGFPFHWEEFVRCRFMTGSTDEADRSTISGVNGFDTSLDGDTENPLPMSLDDVPVTRGREFLMFSRGDIAMRLIENCIANCAKIEDKHKNEEDASVNGGVLMAGSSNDVTPKNHIESKVEGKRKGRGGPQCATNPGIKKVNTTGGKGIFDNSCRRVTRSMSRLACQPVRKTR